MLTGISAARYEERPIWTGHDPEERRLLTQAFEVVSDTLPESAYEHAATKEA